MGSPPESVGTKGVILSGFQTSTPAPSGQGGFPSTAPPHLCPGIVKGRGDGDRRRGRRGSMFVVMQQNDTLCTTLPF